MAEVYHNDDDTELLNTKEILNDNYNYICDSIKEEGYKIENPKCNLFKELLYEDKVVGFVTYDYSKGVGDFSLNEIYVLPEFRGNKYFISELEYMLMSGSTVSIYEPTHRIIELLLDNNYAKKLDNNLVVTSINLDVNEDLSECNIDNYDLDENLIHSCTLYDLNISACLILEDISSSNAPVIYYSRCLDDDNKYYSASSIRENINKEYFENIQDSILTNHEKYINIMMELEEHKPTADFDIDEIIGRPPHLSEYLEGLINEEIITKDKALKIQKQMIDEYDSGLILSESLLKRLEYLSMEDIINEEKKEEGFDATDFDLICPYCEFPITPISKTCDVCGFNLEGMLDVTPFEDIKKELIENIHGMKKEGLSDEEINEITKAFAEELSTGSELDEKAKEMMLSIVKEELNKNK